MTDLKYDQLNISYNFSFTRNQLDKLAVGSELDREGSFCRFYRLDELLYDGKQPQRAAFQNVLAAINIVDFNFIYVIRGDRQGTHVYFGVAAKKGTKAAMELGDFSIDVLEASFQGMFRGSSLSLLKKGDVQKEIFDTVDRANYLSVALGFPSFKENRRNDDEEDYQGIERLVSAMHGEIWQMVIVCEPVSVDDISAMRDEVYNLYDQFSMIAKQSWQHSKNDSTSQSYGSNTGNSETSGTNTSSGKSETTGTNSSSSHSQGISKSHASTDGETVSVSDTTGKTVSQSISKGESRGTSTSQGDSSSNSKGKNTSESDSSSSRHSKSMGQSSSETHGYSSSQQESQGKTNGVSDSKGESASETKGKSRNTGTTDSSGTSDSTQTSSGKNESLSYNQSTGQSRSQTSSEGTSVSNTQGHGTAMAATVEVVNKKATEFLKYIDESLLPRLQNGNNRGMYKTAVYLMAESKSVNTRLCNNVTAIFQGNKCTFNPLRATSIAGKAAWISDLQIHSMESNGADFTVLYGVPAHDNQIELATYLTCDEVSMLAGLPQHEVPGIAIRQYVPFGLNVPLKDQTELDGIVLGKLIYGDAVLRENNIVLNRNVLNKHVFVTGITGSGKTVTCKQLLANSHMPFLVIEPAKTEYRELLNVKGMENLVVFTMGNERGLPLRFNPFELVPGENLTSHIDLVKAAFVSSFDFEASMPQIFEMALYESYRELGWDTETGENPNYDPLNDDGHLWPTLSTFIKQLEKVVEEQKFGPELQGNYRGSLISRIANLTYGAKGKMLNCRKSIDFQRLLCQKVVFEMDELKSPQDKALLMALILGRLGEAVKLAYRENPEFRHITLVEEAHRLLSKVMPGDSEGKVYSVSMFTDMLAEIRKYGESLIIVDQIPNKMAEDVLKNTSTKIVHKIVAKDDKEAIGDTMMLTDEQKVFLSNLLTGRAIVFTENWKKAVCVKVNNIAVSCKSDAVECKIAQMSQSFKYNNLSAYYPELPGDITRDSFFAYLQYNVKIRKALRRLIGKWRKLTTTEREMYANSIPPALQGDNRYIDMFAKAIISDSGMTGLCNDDWSNLNQIISLIWNNQLSEIELHFNNQLRLFDGLANP